MEKLYVWLQEEVLEALELLEKEEIAKGLPDITVEKCKKHLTDGHNTLEVLIQVFKTSGFNTESFIEIIAKIKGQAPDTDEKHVLQYMMHKLFEISRIEGK